MSNDRFTLWREMFVPYLPQGNYQSPNQEIRIVFTDEGFAPFSYPYPTSASGSMAGSRNLFNHYKTDEPNRIKPGTKMMSKAAKVLVTIGAIFIYILIATPILGALNESGASSGLVGLVLLGALIGAIRAIWKKPKDDGGDNSSMLQK